jgi:hypothetical protein
MLAGKPESGSSCNWLLHSTRLLKLFGPMLPLRKTQLTPKGSSLDILERRFECS